MSFCDASPARRISGPLMDEGRLVVLRRFPGTSDFRAIDGRRATCRFATLPRHVGFPGQEGLARKYLRTGLLAGLRRDSRPRDESEDASAPDLDDIVREDPPGSDRIAPDARHPTPNARCPCPGAAPRRGLRDPLSSAPSATISCIFNVQICHAPLAAIHHLRSGRPLLCYPLSAIRYLLSALSSQLSAFRFQVSGFRFQIFALSFQVSAARMRIRRGDPCAASKPATNRTPSASGTHVVSAPGAGNPPKPADSHQATVVSCCASNTSPSLVSVPARSRTEIGNAPDNQACESDPGSSNEPFDRHN